MKLKTKNIRRIHIIASDGSNPSRVIFEVLKPLEPKKLSSTWFPQLLDIDNYNPKGDKLLEFWGLAQGEPFDNYYSLRGEIAEVLVSNMLKKRNYKVTRYNNKKELDYDVFKYEENNQDKLNKLYKYFGGLPDIVYEDGNEKILLEVKSKDMSAIDKIQSNPPQYEILQGKQLALLYGLDKVTMTYVFFSENMVRKMYIALTTPFDLEQSVFDFFDKIGELQYGKDKDYFIIKKEYTFNRNELLEQMKKAYKYADGFRQTLTVNFEDLSKELNKDIFRVEKELEE